MRVLLDERDHARFMARSNEIKLEASQESLANALRVIHVLEDKVEMLAHDNHQLTLRLQEEQNTLSSEEEEDEEREILRNLQ